MGRPTKYKKEYAAQAKVLTKLGATDKEMADFFGVNLTTLYLWKNTHATFSNALKIGKGDYDERVKKALAMSAIGYSCEETKVNVVDGAVVLTPVIKHYPPNPAACKLWLANRQPQEWTNTSDNDEPEPINVEIVVNDGRIRE